MKDYKRNVAGKIKILFPNGYGYIVADEPLDATNKDIYFHFSSLIGIGIDWTDLTVGQKVIVGMISITSKGPQGLDVEPLRAKSKARSARKAAA